MVQDYRYLKKRLPSNVFKPNHWFLWPLLFTQSMGFLAIYMLGTLSLPWYACLGLSLLIGYCWAIGGLLGHDLLHGSIARDRKWQDRLGFFCFLPFLISPTFWRYWHNNLHHSYTQKLIMDPDAYPTLKVFKQSRFIQWMYPFTPGSGKKRSYLYFFFWFSFNVQVAQHYFRYRNKTFSKLDHKQVNRELIVAGAIHLAGLIWLGPGAWLWAVVLPFFIMNYLPFSYISTNHNLSPLTKKNDPLVNSLTVTNHPLLEALHINFGYHVEHHLFPTISGYHLKKVHGLLKEEFPEKYQYMPKWRAIQALYKTARIYKNSETLLNPLTGKTYPTIHQKKPIEKGLAETPSLHPSPSLQESPTPYRNESGPHTQTL